MLLTASTSHGQCWSAPSSSGAGCIEERRRHGTWLSASQERSLTQHVGVVHQSATVSAATSDRSRLSPRGSSFPRHRKPPRPRRALWGHGRLIPVGHGTPGGALLCGTKRGRDVRAWMLDATLSFTIWRLLSAAASWRRGVRGSNPEKFGERWRSIIYRPRRAGFPAGSWPVSCRTARGRVVVRRH